MNEIKVYDKQSMAAELAAQARTNGPDLSNPVIMAERRIGANHGDTSAANFSRLYGASAPKKLLPSGVDYSAIARYGGAIHVPQKWSDGRTESVYSRAISGRFAGGPKAALTGNTLLPDWATLWDALRIDLTTRKNAIPTVRQLFYTISNRPDASRTNNIAEMMPYGVEFKLHNGTGQPVNQGDKGEGMKGSFDIEIYAAGFMWDLLATLFDKSLDMTALSDAVAVAYNAKRDDLSMSPILADVYGTVGTTKWTAAATTSGAGRQELLYDTIENMVDGLGKRTDPVTGRKIDVGGSYLLCSGNVARHVNRVINGLPENANNKRLGAITEVAGVVAYDGEVINMRDHTVTYSGVGDTYMYLVKPNRYMNIFVKQGLTTEVDMQPDVKTLAQQEYAYYFAEGQYNAEGIANFIQKATLPAW